MKKEKHQKPTTNSYIELDTPAFPFERKQKKSDFDWIFVKRFIVILKKSFRSQVSAFILTVLLFLTLASVYVGSYTGKIIGKFYGAITLSDADEFVQVLWQAVLIILLSGFIEATTTFKKSWLSLVLRTHLVHFVHRFYYAGAYYKLCFLTDVIDNPDQRITRDIELWCEKFTNILVEIISSPVIIGYYTYLCVVQINWYAPLIVYGYFIVGYAINKVIMSPIANLVAKQEKLEGNFRFLHMRVRMFGESIAMYNANEKEKKISNVFFDALMLNKYDVVIWEWVLNCVVNIWSYAGSILNYCVVAMPVIFFSTREGTPEYVAEASFNVIMLISGFSKITNISALLSELAGFTARVAELVEFIEKCESSPPNYTTDDEGIQIQNFSCYTPEGDLLLEDINLSILRGERVLIRGESGSGKSTLLRCICGIWPFYDGTISLPKNIFFCPQEPYITIGGIYSQISYPKEFTEGTETDIIQLVEKLKIDHLTQLDGEPGTWARGLSRGERQRVGLCRLLFHSPIYAILDEATNCIDEEMESVFYQLCEERNITILSVGHNNSLLKFHQKTFNIQDKTLH